MGIRFNGRSLYLSDSGARLGGADYLRWRLYPIWYYESRANKIPVHPPPHSRSPSL